MIYSIEAYIIISFFELCQNAMNVCILRNYVNMIYTSLLILIDMLYSLALIVKQQLVLYREFVHNLSIISNYLNTRYRNFHSRCC